MRFIVIFKLVKLIQNCLLCLVQRIDFAAAALGDIVFVDLPSVGAKFSAGDSFGSVESVKAASDVYSPVAGEVVAINKVSQYIIP